MSMNTFTAFHSHLPKHEF